MSAGLIELKEYFVDIDCDGGIASKEFVIG